MAPAVIFSTSFDDDPFLLAMAKKYPDVVFRQASALASSDYPQNVGSQNALIYQGHYVNGVAAGLCTTTNQLGFVAGMPFGPVLLNVNSFLLGCRQTNPEATVRVIFTGGWEDAAHDAAATNALVDAGCDVIACHLDAPRVVIETAEGRGVKTCGHAFDQAQARAQGLHHRRRLQLDRHVRDVHRDAAEGRNPAELRHRRIRQGLCRSSPFGAGATPAAINAAKTAMQAMKNGDAIFVGPHHGQHREARGAGGNDLWALCRQASADRLSDRGRRRLDHLIGFRDIPIGGEPCVWLGIWTCADEK